MTSKLLFISDNVRESSYFTNNLLPDVSSITLTPKDTITSVRQKLQSINPNTINNIGLVFDNTAGRAPFMEYTVAEHQSDIDAHSTFMDNIISRANTNNTIEYIDLHKDSINEYDKDRKIIKNKRELIDTNVIIDDYSITPNFHISNQFFSNDFIALINEIKTNNNNFNTIDIISCNIQYHTQFDQLFTNGITVRYSTNITGQGGDWILESHNINVTPVYFTDAVRSYPYGLGAVQPNTQIGSDWVIDSADKMYWLMTYTSNTGVAPNLSSSFIITTNIDMNDVTGGGPSVFPTRSIGGVTLVALAGARFIGTLKGNNKVLTIRNIDFVNFTGIFGNFGVLGGSVTSTLVENLSVIFTTPNIIYNQVANSIVYGLFCGWVRGGTINNCSITFANIGNITITLNNTTGTPGSVVEFGLILGRKSGDSNITNCSVTYIQNNSINIIGNYRGSSRIGGLIGVAGAGINTTLIANNNINLLNDLIFTYTTNVSTTTEFSSVGGVIGITAQVTNPGTGQTFFNNCSITCRNLIITVPSLSGTFGIDRLISIGGWGGNMVDFNNIYDNCIATIAQLTITYNENFGGSGTATRFVFIGGFFGSQITLTQSSIINSKLSVGTLNISCNTNTIPYFDLIGGFLGNVDSNPGISCSTTNSLCIINNLVITIAGSGNGQSLIGGVLGEIIKGTVNNLDATIQNFTILSNETNSIVQTGGYVGYRFNGTITNSSVSILGTFTTTQTNTKQIYNGGFIGLSDGDLVNSITNSSCSINTYTFTTNASVSPYFKWCGGFCGRVILSNATISNCTGTINNMSITSSGILLNGENRIGCVFGENDRANISNVTSNITTYNANIADKSSFVFFGGLVGYIFGGITQNCNTNITTITVENQLTENKDVLMGGAIGRAASSAFISNNTTQIFQLSFKGRASSRVELGGFMGRAADTSIVQGCNTTVGSNSILYCVSIALAANVAGLIAANFSSGLFQNNTISYGSQITFKANQASSTIIVNSLVSSGVINGTNNNVFLLNGTTNNLSFASFPLIFQSIPNGIGITFEGNNYFIQPQTITIQTNPFFLIDLSDITVYVYLRFIPPANTAAPCSIANVCDENPQTANYDNQNVVHNASGAQLVTAVSQFYGSAAMGITRPNAPPIFKTYGQMMDWKQRQNRR